MATVCIVGLGYIGLPTALVAAQAGLDVVGYDIDSKRVNHINNCEPVIQEPEIVPMLQKVLRTTTFRATDCIETAHYYVIAVPTPFAEYKNADLSYVWQATKTVCTVLKKGSVIILESTVPVGTTQRMADLIERETGLLVGKDVFVAHCPERVLPGKIFYELVHNARMIGGVDQESMQKAAQFYKYFVKGPLYLTNAATAEMVKLVENSSRDVQIAFANQVAAMAYEMNLNPFEVIELANKHPRVSILSPSCGVGGHCIAVDPWFLIETFPGQTELLKQARLINDQKPYDVVDSVKEYVTQWYKTYPHNVSCAVALLGLTYKPNTDDIRESPALHIAQALADDERINLLVCEPHIAPEELEKRVKAKPVSLAQALDQAAIIVCLVKHDLFKVIVQQSFGAKRILDICGLFYQQQPGNDAQEKVYWPTSNAYYKMLKTSRISKEIE